MDLNGSVLRSRVESSFNLIDSAKESLLSFEIHVLVKDHAYVTRVQNTASQYRQLKVKSLQPYEHTSLVYGVSRSNATFIGSHASLVETLY